MVHIKTITTSAGENEIAFEKFDLRGAKDSIYVWVRNLGENDVYMSDKSGLSAEDDDVILLKAGSLGLVTTALDHKIYIIGATKAECHAQFFAECPFKGVGGSGSGGAAGYIGKTTTPLSDGSKDEYINLIQEQLTSTQLALCELYEELV